MSKMTHKTNVAYSLGRQDRKQGYGFATNPYQGAFSYYWARGWADEDTLIKENDNDNEKGKSIYRGSSQGLSCGNN